MRAGGNSSTESMGLATAAEMSPMGERRRLAPGGVSSAYPRALCSSQTMFCLSHRHSPTCVRLLPD